MHQDATIINFYSAGLYGGVLQQLKAMLAPSDHSYEMATHDLIVDIEALALRGVLRYGELSLLAGKAMDVIAYFRLDVSSLAGEDPWYRASVVHQIGCGLLQVLRLLRPEMADMMQLNEVAHDLYRYRAPLETIASHAASTPRPLHGHRW